MPDFYNYNYNYNKHHQGGGSDWPSWIFTILALLAFPPVGLILLFRKLMGYSGGSRRGKSVGRHPYDLQRDAFRWQSGNYAPPGAQPQGQATQQEQNAQPQQSAKTGQWQAQGSAAYYQYAPQSGKAARQQKKAANLVAAPKGRGLIIAGGILAGFFSLSSLMFLAEAISYGYFFGDELFGFLLSLSLAGLGGVLTSVGILRQKSQKRYRKYLSYIGKRQNLSVASLAQTMGISYKKVCDDLQNMLDFGILPTGYIDYQNGRLILSEEGIVEEAPPPAAKEAPPKPTGDDEILSEIQLINDLIPDPDMSMKIDRIGEITGKILTYQRNNPTKAGQLRQFLNYYLPTTLKILRAYAQLGAQGVEGENITGAKARIEGMMDKVVEGFEKQLDRLFQNDAMDITTDVAVLERMIESDGLANGGATLQI